MNITYSECVITAILWSLRIVHGPYVLCVLSGHKIALYTISEISQFSEDYFLNVKYLSIISLLIQVYLKDYNFQKNLDRYNQKLYFVYTMYLIWFLYSMKL